MPTNKPQKLQFAFLTVVITVHTYVFYSLYGINGNQLMQWTGARNSRLPDPFDNILFH